MRFLIVPKPNRSANVRLDKKQMNKKKNNLKYYIQVQCLEISLASTTTTHTKKKLLVKWMKKRRKKNIIFLSRFFVHLPLFFFSSLSVFVFKFFFPFLFLFILHIRSIWNCSIWVCISQFCFHFVLVQIVASDRVCIY